jgi:hypothetical protein
MPTLLKIPDTMYADAAAAIAAIRARSDKGTSAIDVEKALRAYVALGTAKEIPDWSWTLADADKAKIADAVTSKVFATSGARLSSSKVYVDLEIMETLAGNGEIPYTISRPRESQTRFEQQLATAPDITSIQANVSKVFGNILPDTKTLVIAGVALAALLILTRR